MRVIRIMAALVALMAVAASPAFAADNQLTEGEKKQGWILLFDGKSLDGWFCNNGNELKPVIEENALTPAGSGGYVLMHKQQFGDFIFKCDMKAATDRLNSGIFVRTGEPKNPVQTGLEVQVSSSRGTGKHDYGAIYDAAEPVMPAPESDGEWDHIEITCIGPHVMIAINGQTITHMNCEKYPEEHMNADGTKNKYDTPIADFPTEGYLGFQDHFDKTKALYKNIKILPLD